MSNVFGGFLAVILGIVFLGGVLAGIPELIFMVILFWIGYSFFGWVFKPKIKITKKDNDFIDEISRQEEVKNPIFSIGKELIGATFTITKIIADDIKEFKNDKKK